jgi:endoglucanase
MKIRLLLSLLLAGGLAIGQYRRGVNVSEAEFGQTSIPGTLGKSYTFGSENTFRYFGGKQLGLMRVAVLWERLQPVLGGPLDPAYLQGLKNNIAWAGAHGGEVIVDIHNYGRYSFNESGGFTTYIIDNVYSGVVKVSSADLADLWTRLSTEFKFEGAVYAYDLMNEPHDMGTASWQNISQAALSAIRANQDDKLVLIPGNSWSSGNRWVASNGQPWIQDPANNFAYEAHQYFDSDESGTYAHTAGYATSYDAQLAKNSGLATAGQTRVQHFIDWCAQYHVRGIVDEYGIPDDDARWFTVLDNFFIALDAAGMDGTCWAAGEWWGSYALSVQPTANFTVDRPQMPTLLAHRGGGYLTALSAASVSVARATAGSLVTLYGSGFTAQTAGTPSSSYPTALADITVQVTDASGATFLAGLLYVAPGQINLQTPAGAAPGRATFTVLRGASQVASGGMQVAASGPAIFTANNGGFGLAAAQVIRVKADNTQTYEPVVQLDPSQNQVVAAPIVFGPDRLFLALYGTGVRGASASVNIAGVELPVQYAGPQAQYPGLDQVNVELPPSLAGAGQVNVTVTIDGVAANTVAIVFR